DCCGVCDDATDRCSFGADTCRGVCVACAADADCCRGSCVQGTCAIVCAATGGSCNVNSDCCSASCSGNPPTCDPPAPLPPPPGTGGVDAGPGGTGGVDAGPTATCTPANGACTDSASCCTGLCTQGFCVFIGG